MTTGRKILKRRKALGMSQRDLQAKSGVTQVCISHTEKGRHQPNLVSLRKIAKGLGCRPEELL